MWKKVGRPLLPLVFWLAVWELLALAVDHRALGEAWALWRQTGEAAGLMDCLLHGQRFILPAPLGVAAALAELAGTAAFWQTALLSLARVFGGLLAGVAIGTLLAVLTSAFRWADILLSPAVRVIRAVPVASFIILVLLWVDRDLVPVVISALMVLPVVWGNVSQGAAEADGQLLELARAYRFGRWKTVRLVYVPSVLPYFASAFRTALGLAWKAGVAAEVLCLPKAAIGTQVYNAKIYLETPDLFAWTLVVLALSFALEGILGKLLIKLEGKGGAPCASGN